MLIPSWIMFYNSFSSITILSHISVRRTVSHFCQHYDDVIMGAIASQITSLAIVYSTAYSDADQRKHQSSASLAFVWGSHRGPVNSPHKLPVTRKMFPFDDVLVSHSLVRFFSTITFYEVRYGHDVCYTVFGFWKLFDEPSSWSIKDKR